MTNDLNTIAKRIRLRLIVLDINQTKLADKLGLSVQMVSQWALGRSVPRTRHLEKLCEVLHCSIYWLLTGQEQPPSQTR